MILRTILYALGLITVTSRAQATPGELLPDQFPGLSSRATVIGSSATPDGDGAYNLLEYAGSTDPFQSHPGHAVPHALAPNTWQVPCNPEAPDILRRIETSFDLLTWIPAGADQIRIETSAPCLTWKQLPGQEHAFTRLRVFANP